MNINYGLLPPMETPRRGPDGKPIPLKQRGREKKKLMSERALRDLDAWLAGRAKAAAE
jgi:methylenetetrahydrofolate--tRNA-(uracil-5-)-methyltransferase